MTVTQLPVEPKRDRYGRYLLPHPETGVEQAWTRVTTIANTLADRFGLEQWGNRNVVLGIGARPDLYALAVSSTPDDKAQLNRVVKQAQEAAKASSGANLGTALHRLTERVDRGEIFDIPREWAENIDSYVGTLVDYHVGIDPNWIERIVILPKYRIAGTLDRLVTLYGDTHHTVADLKTGKDAVKYGTGETALQLALYANATLAWNGEDYDPIPEIDTKQGLIIHLPVDGKCELHLVDIAAGRTAVRLALDVREWRKRKDLTAPYSLLDPEIQPVRGGSLEDDDDDDDW